MDNSIEALKVEQSVVSKELARFRPCHSESRCYFCREWAQFVYKKHVVSGQKTQDNQDQPRELKAGRYRLRLPKNDSSTDSSDIPVDHKEHSRQLLNGLKQRLIEQDKNNNPTTATTATTASTLTEDIISACNAWIEAPSSITTLNSLFEPIQFDPYDPELLEEERADPKEPGHLLDPLIVKRQNIYLPSKEFRLLKNLTGDVLLSHREAMCDHTRPEWKSPNDLDVERVIFNEKMDKEIKNELVRLEQALDASWKHLTEFMAKLCVLDKERLRLLGKEECQKDVDYFSSKQEQNPAFQEYWTPLAGNFKKKQRNPVDLATVDKAFDDYFDQLIKKAEQFQNEFVIPRLEAVVTLLKKLWELLMPSIRQMAERMAKFECDNENGDNIGKRMKTNSSKLVKSVENLDPMTDVKTAADNIQQETELRIKEYAMELDALKKAYREGKPSVMVRLDKIANNKPFKKQIKKAEGGYHSIRQHFRYQLTQKIFPESMFAKFCLVCLEALMQEGELTEVMTIEMEMKRFAQEQKEMAEERQYLFGDFEDGIVTGRRELAGVMGRLFLKEGMRIQGENLALQRQYTLLQSLGVKDVPAPPPAASSPSSSSDQQKQKPALKQDSLIEKKKKTRSKKDIAANEATNEPLVAKQKDVELMSDRLEMLNKLCDSIPNIDDADEKKKSELSNNDGTTATASKLTSATSSSTTPDKAAAAPKNDQKKSTLSTSKVSASKTSIPKASSRKAASPALSTSVSSKPPPPIIPPLKPTPAVSPTGVPKSSSLPAAVAAKPSAASVVAAAAATSSGTRTPSASKTKVTEPKAGPKKTVPESVTKTTFPPLPQQEKPSKSTSTITATDEKSQDLGGWGSTNAAQMVKGWNSLKDPVSSTEEKKQKQQKPSTITTVKNNVTDEPQDDGWGTAPPVPKVDSQSDGWGAENTAAWKNNKDKIRQVVGTVAAGASTKQIESKKPATTSDGWTEIPVKKKQQEEQPIGTNDGWGTSVDDANDGWGTQEKKEAPVVNDGWGAPQEKKVNIANDGWEVVQEKRSPVPANNDGSEVVQEKRSPVPANNDGWEVAQEKKSSAPADNDGWGAPQQMKISKNDGWDTPSKGSVKNDSWGATTTNDGWGSQDKKPKAAAGWGTSSTSINWRSKENKPTTATNKHDGGWKSSSSSSSSAKATTDDGWGASSEAAANDGWGPEPKKSTNDGWGVSANDGWSKEGSNGWGEKKSSTHYQSTGNNTRNRHQQQQQQKQQQQQQQPAGKWSNAGDGGWGNTTGWNNQDQTGSHQSQSIPDNGWDHNNQQQSQLQPQQSGKPVTTTTTTPPGMSAPGTPSSQQHSDTEIVNFSLKDIIQQQPQPQQTTISQPPGLVNTASSAAGLTVPPPTTTTNSSRLASVGNVASLSVSVAQHEQIPAEQMRTMTQDNLISFIQTLQHDNTRLLQSLIAGQQEMSLQTSRYTELMTLSRERETQLLQLFEARKQTEMEEARRYILSLEARISTLEGQLKTANTAAATASAAAAAAAAASNSNNGGGDMGNIGGATAGFGNQDLFAGYRESMRPNNNNSHRSGSGGRRYYNRQPPAIRCGNCGGTGHTSADCQDVCRYCGSQEHLSETCTMNP